MNDKKISKMPMTGMQHLIEQSEGRTEVKPDPIPEWPKDKCLKLRCILEGVDYYVPKGRAGVAADQPPYHPFGFDVGYSALFSPTDPANPIAIIKHVHKRFFQTGIATEIAPLPKWWDRRDEMA